ncbi:hypothetical protein F993_01476 [Acinetobacter proteolyticus]|uniref:Uncharacterized protein n=1 Tax=Acinetobacter proteolyticus TaxID=1776741 RepID=A0ABP2TPI4_9GAMM|nr:hypothetical protein [Acinetobacter proteolyticus]ENU24160.1 hypothetical protein F993_01476 [Acinetobacter proteolyticus]
MSDKVFLNAFNKSISVAERKKMNIQEIENIFSLINTEISTGTSGKFSINLKKSIIPTLGIFLSSLAKSSGNEFKEEYFLEVKNNVTGDSFNMADIKYGDQGYPIQLFFKNNSLTSNSKESLVNDLSDILGSAAFGEELEKIM